MIYAGLANCAWTKDDYNGVFHFVPVMYYRFPGAPGVVNVLPMTQCPSLRTQQRSADDSSHVHDDAMWGMPGARGATGVVLKQTVTNVTMHGLTCGADLPCVRLGCVQLKRQPSPLHESSSFTSRSAPLPACLYRQALEEKFGVIRVTCAAGS
jgi:hypothetical protein